MFCHYRHLKVFQHVNHHIDLMFNTQKNPSMLGNPKYRQKEENVKDELQTILDP